MNASVASDLERLLDAVKARIGLRVNDTPAAQKAHREAMAETALFLRQEYGHLTLNEVVLAYILGMKADLPDMFAGDGTPLEIMAELNPRSVGKVLAAYEAYKRHTLRHAPPETPPVALLPPPPPDPAEVDRGWKLLLRRAWDMAKEGQAYNDMGNAIYDWLDKAGGVHFTPERKWQFMRQAQQRLLDESKLLQAQDPANKKYRALIDKLAEAIGADKLYEPQKMFVVAKAKQLAFTTLLQEQHDMGVTWEDFLDTLTVVGAESAQNDKKV